MERSEVEALADIAYGFFEHYLNNQLHARRRPLFHLVEEQIPFREEFTEIYNTFREEYPDLGAALDKQFTSPEDMYLHICEGEGIIPSKTTQTHWITEDAPDTNPRATDDENAGKWLIFLEPDRVDELWKKIRDATARGELGISAKVSTAKRDPDARDDRQVIYVYTANWADEPDVMGIREKLREIGITDRIGYKRNIETYRGEYSSKGKKVTYYSA